MITKPPDQNDFKLETVVVLDRLPKPIDFGFRGTGSSFELLPPPSYLWNKCSYKIQILCTSALQAVAASRAKIMPECNECHKI